MVAAVWEAERLTYGDVFGPYTRLIDAERCLARVGDRYTIIESPVRWYRRETQETP